MALGLRTLLTVVAASVAFAAPASPADVVEYYHLDAIGNVRAVTNQAGQVIERHDYLPFGEECTIGPCASNPGITGGQPRHFTGKERDTETGIDYFGARYYGSKIGRFTTTDPVLDPKAALVNPQRWNRYSCVSNNPLRYVDPDGREQTVIVGGMTYMGGVDAMPAGNERAKNIVFGALVAGAVGVAASFAAPAALVEARIALGLMGPTVGAMVAGAYGQVTRSELEMAAKAGGPTVSAVTRLTSAPEAGRALSVAAGEGAEALANAARGGGVLYRGEIPQALIATMEKVGLVRVSTTMIEGGARATEYRFAPAATEFVKEFFNEAK